MALTTTSKLKETGEGTSSDYLEKALSENDKAEVLLIRYMSDDVKVTEPNAIYLQCVVPQVGVKLKWLKFANTKKLFHTTFFMMKM